MSDKPLHIYVISEYHSNSQSWSSVLLKCRITSKVLSYGFDPHDPYMLQCVVCGSHVLVVFCDGSVYLPLAEAARVYPEYFV